LHGLIGKGQDNDVAKKGLSDGATCGTAELCGKCRGLLRVEVENLKLVATGDGAGADAAGHLAGAEDADAGHGWDCLSKMSLG